MAQLLAVGVAGWTGVHAHPAAAMEHDGGKGYVITQNLQMEGQNVQKIELKRNAAILSIVLVSSRIEKHLSEDFH